MEKTAKIATGIIRPIVNIVTITQALSIIEQLEAGIRFLDIRCRHIDNKFAIHHGKIFLGFFFGDVLNWVQTFLANYQTETVFMRIKPEHTEGEGVTRSFVGKQLYLCFIVKEI